jgi:mannobiose 2-epimerase
MSDPVLQVLHEALERELTGNILPYWLTRAIDHEHGGFVGLITADEVAHPEAPKGAVLTARILWTFSAAYRVLGNPEYLDAAQRALQSFRERLVDPEHGGVYWMVNADGTPNDPRKHVYGQAFAIYALSEYARATDDRATLRQAAELFRLVERHAHDSANGGYEEAFSRQWVLLDDVRLSDVDANERKSMNTHLHLVEAYANLLRVWPDPLLRRRLVELLELFVSRIADPHTAHLRQFFDADWTPKTRAVSFGHDIEASWLLLDAADVAGDDGVRTRIRALCLRTADVVREEALDAGGGIFYDRSPNGVVDTDKEWWPQAEAILGFVSAYRETGRAAFRDAAVSTWSFTQRHIIDARNGEWLRRVARDGVARPGHEKVGPWKCPYHNARACLALIESAGIAVRPAAAAADAALRTA